MRDLLIRLGQTGLFRARWTEQILDEMTRSIRRRRPDLDEQRLARTRELMCEAVPNCLVTGYESLIDGLTLPDPHDRNVLAAALRCSAQVIVTSNLGDFPSSTLEPFNIEAQSHVLRQRPKHSLYFKIKPFVRPELKQAAQHC